jgi:hypothetical protein
VTHAVAQTPSHAALAVRDGFEPVELVQYERETVAGRRVARVQHLAARDRTQSKWHHDELRTAPGDDDPAAIGNGPLEGFVLCVGQTGNPVRVSRAILVLGIRPAWRISLSGGALADRTVLEAH